MNDARGVFSSWKRWQVDTDNSYHNSPPTSDMRHSSFPPQPVVANVSRSDPESLRCATRNCSRDDYLDNNKAYAVNAWNNVTHPHQCASSATSRTAACQFSRCSSFTEGFRTENEEDEPNDTLVWDSSRKLYPIRSRNNNQRLRREISDDECLSMTLRAAPSSKPSDYDGQLAGVAQQLELIKTTQDSILSELSNDISSLQFENVQLKNTNEHLTMQNSHLLQVINELSQEVESMRQIFRNRGWTVGLSGARISKERLLGRSPSKSHQPVAKNNGVFTVKSRGTKEVEAESGRSEVEDNLPIETDDQSACESPIPGDDQVHKLSNTGLHSSRASHKHRRRVKSTKHSTDEKQRSRKKREAEVVPQEPEHEVEEDQGCLKKFFSKKIKRKPSLRNNE